jgi:antitoxin ParD1/3/4
MARRFVMPKSTSVTLDEHLVGFIDRQIAEGRYGSASEVVRAALEFLQEHEAKLEALRGALVEGEQSGPSEPFDFDAFIEAGRSSDL